MWNHWGLCPDISALDWVSKVLVIDQKPSHVKQPFFFFSFFCLSYHLWKGSQIPDQVGAIGKFVFVLSLKLFCRSESPEQQNYIVTENGI